MQRLEKGNLRPRSAGKRVILWLEVLACCAWLVATASPAGIPQGKRGTIPFGIAWQVKGPWRAEGQTELISSGDAIAPGSLLHPEAAVGPHSILILLPDGQRILYECYLARDCSRDFRVPLLNRKPDRFAVDFLARVRAALALKAPEAASGRQNDPWIAQDEVVAPISPDHQVEVAGLASDLSNGEYFCDIRSLQNGYPPRFQVPTEKTGHSIRLPLPAPGLYEVRIFDRMKTPRIDLLVGAAGAFRRAAYLRSFDEAHALLKEWNTEYQGWPVHAFRRAYIESLFLGVRPRARLPQADTRRALKIPGTAAEPVFSPQPGVFDGNATVTLTCGTPGAVMHYTIDGSQPLDSSPVYRAPIIMQGTGLTIKAYATAPGKKDSPVVTGIFRIGE